MLVPILGLWSNFLRPMHQLKKQHFKVKFWNWGPITIWYNKTCVNFFVQKSLHPFISSCFKLKRYTEDKRKYVANIKRSWGLGFRRQVPNRKTGCCVKVDRLIWHKMMSGYSSTRHKSYWKGKRELDSEMNTRLLWKRLNVFRDRSIRKAIIYLNWNRCWIWAYCRMVRIVCFY